MDGPHDLGGRLGFGPVPVHATRPWTTWWEQAAGPLAAMMANLAGVNGDSLRHLMECLPPDLYRRLSPAGRWLEVAVRCAVDAGVATPAELDDRARRRAEGLRPLPAGEYPEPRRLVDQPPRRLSHSKRDPGYEAPDPWFRPGQHIRTRTATPPGHTRLAGYLRGRPGVITAVNGYWVYPDANANGGEEEATWVYTVRFAAADLWPNGGADHPAPDHPAPDHPAPDHEVLADLFEPYLLEDESHERTG